jgi:hypothetical protein
MRNGTTKEKTGESFTNIWLFFLNFCTISSISSPLFLFEVQYHYLTIAQKSYLYLLNSRRKQLSLTLGSYDRFFDKREDSSSPRVDEFKNQWNKTLFFKSY